MNTLEDAFLDSLASRMVVEDVAETKAAQTGRQMPTVAEAIGKPEQILEPAKPETAAAVAKGMAQGFVGLPGDLIALARGVYDLAKSGGDLEAFVKGLESATGLPTTEDIKKFLDEAGLKVGGGDMTAETVGEFAAPGGYVKGAKAAAKAAKGAAQKVTSTPPRGSIKLAPDLEVEIAPAERSKNFKNWFGNSKVVDEKGKPLVVYHGTTTSFNVFKPSNRGAQGPGIYFTDNPKEAGMYTRGTESTGQNIMPVYVSMKNPLRVGSGDNVFEMLDAGDDNIVDVLKAKGYDGIIWDRVEDLWSIKVMKDAGLDPTGDSRHFVVFDPKQIKSAIGNKGTFDPTSANILRGAAVTPVAPAVMQDEEKK